MRTGAFSGNHFTKKSTLGIIEARRESLKVWHLISGDMAPCNAPLLIGSGQTISQPYIVALMTETLELAPGERVLEIGTAGST